MTVTNNGDLWMQTASKDPLFRLHNGVWIPVPGAPKSSGPAVTLITDQSDRVWASFLFGLIVVYDGNDAKVLKTFKDLTVGNVTAVYESGKQIWAGGESGLIVFSDDRPFAVHFEGENAIRGISGIIRLDDGSLWINSIPGVVRVAASEVAQFLREPSHALRYTLYDQLDGLSGKAPQIRPLPSIVQGEGTTLWFTTTNGAVSLDTAHIAINGVVPPVSIPSALADGNEVDMTDKLTLPAGTRDLQLNYTALSLSIPERVRFRYRLEGFDDDWQEAGSRRQAFYTHLPPGNYTFRAIAANNDGLWNDVGATLKITLPPTFLQSAYFKVILGLALLLVLWMLYRLRLRQVTGRVRARLNERFAERERIARDLHDTFLQGIQGLLLSLNSVTRRMAADDPNRRALEETLHQSDQVILEGRKLVLDMRAQSTGVNELSQDLKDVCAKLAMTYSVPYVVSQTGESRPLNSLVSEELFKIGREAITNAFQHANASTIQVEIHYGRRELRLSIRDDGRGIASEVLEKGFIPNHFGLPGMRERSEKIGANLHVESGVGKGTCIRIDLPSRLAYRSVRAE
jgi:signal transduction histidine kinase